MQDVFDVDYFYDANDIANDDMYEISSATEATAVKKLLVALFTGPWGLLIGNIVHNYRVKNSTVASLNDCIKAYGKEKGQSAYAKTFKFFKDNGLIETDEQKPTITFSDLTDNGKKFIRGYYSALDEISQFDVNKAESATERRNAEAITTTAYEGFAVANRIATVAVSLGLANLLAALGISATISIPAIVIGLVPSAFNIVDAIKSFNSSKKFKETMKNAKESAYIQGYYRALCDIDADYNMTNRDEYSAATESMMAVLGAAVISQFVMTAKSLIRIMKASKENGPVISLDKIMASGYPKDKAVSEYKKTLKFLISKGYVNPSITTSSTVVNYSDLTPKGLQFIRGYHEAIGNVDIFTVKKAVETNANKIASAKTIADFATSIANVIVTSIAGGFIGGPIGASIVVLSALTSGFDMTSAYIRVKNMQEYNESKPTDPSKKESTENSAKEDVDIFSDSYFDVATESMKDHIIDVNDFNYMPPKEAEKAYKEVVHILVSSVHMTTKGAKRINPDTGYITKADIGIIYHISAVKDLVNEINKIHAHQYKTAKQFVNEFKSVYNDYCRQYDM